LAGGPMMNKSYSLKHWDFMVKIGQWFKDMLNLGMSQISELMHKNFLWNWLRLLIKVTVKLINFKKTPRFIAMMLKSITISLQGSRQKNLVINLKLLKNNRLNNKRFNNKIKAFYKFHIKDLKFNIMIKICQNQISKTINYSLF
jgi:hypothetical protein